MRNRVMTGASTTMEHTLLKECTTQNGKMSSKWALLGIDIGAETAKAILIHEDKLIELGHVPVQGQPFRRVREFINQTLERRYDKIKLALTGSAAPQVASLLDLKPIDEANAIAAACNLLYPKTRTIIEMGRETQKYLRFTWDDQAGKLLLDEANLSSKCAAGSGSFLDHMARRLNYRSVEDFAHIAYEINNPASLSGRCAVFTESDIVHLYQKGTPRERIAAGIHQAICRNYRAAIVRGREMDDEILFIGGVSLNPSIRKYLASELELDIERIIVPQYSLVLGAIGAALRAERELVIHDILRTLDGKITHPLEYEGVEPLRLFKSKVLTSDNSNDDLPRDISVAALGVDIGSVSTKAALVTEIDGAVRILASYYRRTDGDPLEAVRDTVVKIQQQIDDAGLRIGQIVAGTTGSGRYLTGDYLGADVIKNEITAQAQGARAFTPEVESIFEIGGQDSKYIRLDGDVIVDFEMNKACAAGTGAFLEKQAARLNLDITEFGPTALEGRRPPDLDWTCTVFSESASVYYQQNNVPIEDLCAGLCLASAKNYLNKNVASRHLGNTVAFQGAVAFNKGMVAAFETILDRPIIVPPYPHLTGAIGVAWIAYRERSKQSSFRGFTQITTGNYNVTSFECTRCPNRCDVNVFQMEEGTKYYYNDRCERYSAAHKRGLGSHLPDLFALREALLMADVESEPEASAPTIGIPRGLMFTEYYPLYREFFRGLGLRIVTSDLTNKDIVKKGINTVAGEPCFPIKVAHGHVQQLLEKEIDYLFLPAVCDTEQPNPRFRQSHTCPYVMSAPEIISAALGLEDRSQPKLLRPRLFFRRGERHLRRVFRRIARELGITGTRVEKALNAGFKALRDFRSKIEEHGRQIIEQLPPEQRAFIVIGRPYTTYDATVNMDIGKKIQDLGILAIPIDFLPIDSEDISDHWPNAYSRQIQKKLAAARLIHRDPRLRAVVLTYFACGPDSFANPFFSDEVDEPCYIMQIDEHTADAGVITRMEAFADTVSVNDSGKLPNVIKTTSDGLHSVADRKLWVPRASDAAEALAAVFRAWGIDAATLPRSTDPGLNLARRAISEDVCLPMFVTTQDILERVESSDFEPEKEAFFQAYSEGPCRLGMYYMLQRRILDKRGFDQVPLVTLGSNIIEAGLGIDVLITAWSASLAQDMLEKLRLRTRPYEASPGASDRIYQQYLDKLCNVVIPRMAQEAQSRGSGVRTLMGRHTEPLESLLQESQQAFAAVPRSDGDEGKPLVGVVGEWFVRIHEGANQGVARKLERAGGEVWLAPATEFFSYSICIGGIMARDRWQDTRSAADLKMALSRSVLTRVAMRDEHRLFRATLPYLEGYDDIGPEEIIREGSRYIHPSFGGEPICSMGKAIDFARRRLDGIVNVIPFNCMPGNTVQMLSQAFRRDHDGIPFLNLDFDGFVDASRDAKIVSFMTQVKERREARRARGAATR